MFGPLKSNVPKSLTNIVPIDLLFTAGKINLSLYEFTETSDNVTIDNDRINLKKRRTAKVN